jgi:hypothetical protein
VASHQAGRSTCATLSLLLSHVHTHIQRLKSIGLWLKRDFDEHTHSQSPLSQTVPHSFPHRCGWWPRIKLAAPPVLRWSARLAAAMQRCAPRWWLCWAAGLQRLWCRWRLNCRSPRACLEGAASQGACFSWGGGGQGLPKFEKSCLSVRAYLEGATSQSHLMRVCVLNIYLKYETLESRSGCGLVFPVQAPYYGAIVNGSMNS